MKKYCDTMSLPKHTGCIQNEGNSDEGDCVKRDAGCRKCDRADGIFADDGKGVHKKMTGIGGGVFERREQ